MNTQALSGSALYIAPCWSTKRIMDLVNRDEEKLALIIIGDKEFKLTEGLNHMEQQGWRLITVQSNTMLGHKVFPPWIQPDFYYIFAQ